MTTILKFSLVFPRPLTDKGGTEKGEGVGVYNLKTMALTILVYCLVAFIAFGDIFAPLAALLMWPDHLGAPSWRLIVFGSVLFSAGIFAIPLRQLYKFPAFVALATTISIVSVGLYADRLRHARTAEFAADAIIEYSFFRSIREAPREYQFYLHAAALKNCVPYGWSYRTMDFYELPANAAVNVLPGKWLKRCKIRRT